MTYKSKFLSCLLGCLLILSTAAGCSDDEESAKKETSAEITTADTTETTAPPAFELTEEQIKEIKDTYLLSEEGKSAFADEKTSSPIIYSGFTSHYFSTPAKNDNVPVTAVTSILSHSGMHDYIAENSANYIFGEGDGSFSVAAEKYNDKFFDTKGLLVISFVDAEGGSGYNVTGAWDTVDVVGDRSLERLVFSTKKSAGDNTSGHIIVEVDSKFMSLWDAVGIEIYE